MKFFFKSVLFNLLYYCADLIKKMKGKFSMSLFKLIFLGTVCLFLTTAATAAPWPADAGMEIGQIGQQNGLPEDYEPSGAVWHSGRQKLLVVDDSGLISQLDSSGGNITSWNVDEDLEGITLIDPEGSLVYLAVEHPDSILEFDLDTGSLTGREWDLTPWLDGPNNHGLEALTYGNGHFFAGLQEDGTIFEFNLQDNGDVQLLASFASHEARDDLSGLHFDACTGILYAVHDSHDLLVEMTTEGDFIREYDLVGDDQEGIALIGGGTSGQTTLFIAQDSGEVWRYQQYPMAACHPTSGAELTPDSELKQFGCNPNPFNPSTEIFFELNNEQRVALSIHDLQGRHVRTLSSGSRAEGQHRVRWNGCSDQGLPMASGVYFARIATNELLGTTKLMLVR